MPSSQANGSLTGPETERPRHYCALRDGIVVDPRMLPLQRAAGGEEVRSEELEVRFDDDSSIFVLMDVSPLRDHTGRVVGAVGAAVERSYGAKACRRGAALLNESLRSAHQ